MYDGSNSIVIWSNIFRGVAYHHGLMADTKKRRVEEVIQSRSTLPYISQTAFAAVVAAAKNGELPTENLSGEALVEIKRSA